MPTALSLTSAFGFHVEFVDDNGCVVRDQRVKPSDFGHAVRHTFFEAFCRGLVEEYQPLPGGARIAPVFPDGDLASPHAKGFCVTISLSGSREHTSEFDIGYFGSAANRLRAELLRTKQLKGEQELYYRLNAFLDEKAEPVVAPAMAIALEPATRGLTIMPGCRRDFGPAEAWDQPLDSDVPVLVARSVLEEVVEEARADPEREIGGFLLGHLLRDEDTHEVFVAVTGLASAGGTTESSETSLTFKPASFAHVRSIIRLRGAGEIAIGWYHSHPFKLCAECPLPTPPECVAKVLFYSSDDIHLMETTFEQPFMVGLLAAVDSRIETAVGHLPVKLYGWRSGGITSRGFAVVGRTAD